MLKIAGRIIISSISKLILCSDKLQYGMIIEDFLPPYMAHNCFFMPFVANRFSALISYLPF